MRNRRVGDVMTSDVVRVTYGTPFKEVARLLAEHNISGLPVVDGDEKVLGVISETDLMMRQAEQAEKRRRGRWARFRPSRLTPAAREAAVKAQARTAGQLMSEPAITVHALDSVTEAARTMARNHVERLPVVDEEDRLVGIVTRRDLLGIFLRPDREIRAEVVDEVLVRTLWLAPRSIDVVVREGVVTLTGQLERRSEIPIAVRMTGQVDGVVAVIDNLTFREDDSHLQPSEQALHGIADEWVRML